MSAAAVQPMARYHPAGNLELYLDPRERAALKALCNFALYHSSELESDALALATALTALLK